MHYEKESTSPSHRCKVKSVEKCTSSKRTSDTFASSVEIMAKIGHTLFKGFTLLLAATLKTFAFLFI